MNGTGAFLIMWRTRFWLQVECCWMTVRRVLRTSSTVDHMAVRSWPWATCCRPSQSSKRRKILSLKCTRKCLHSQITRQEKNTEGSPQVMAWLDSQHRTRTCGEAVTQIWVAGVDISRHMNPKWSVQISGLVAGTSLDRWTMTQVKKLQMQPRV